MSTRKPLISKGMRAYSAAPRPTPTAPKRELPKRIVKFHEAPKTLGCTIKNPKDMNLVKFIAENPLDDPIGIDLSGGYLMPEDSNFQRLLVAGAEGAVDGIAIIPAHRTITLDLMTACMDEGKASPCGSTAYTIAIKPAPKRFQEVAHRFAKLACEGERPGADGQQAQSAATRRLLSKVDAPSDLVTVGDFQAETWEAARSEV